MAHVGLFDYRKEASAGSAASRSRQGGGADAVSCGHCAPICGLGGRLMRKLRKQSKLLRAAATTTRSSATTFRYQYDPLSYARNFDGDGFGNGLDDDSPRFYHTFSYRFVDSSAGIAYGLTANN